MIITLRIQTNAAVAIHRRNSRPTRASHSTSLVNVIPAKAGIGNKRANQEDPNA